MPLLLSIETSTYVTFVMDMPLDVAKKAFVPNATPFPTSNIRHLSRIIRLGKTDAKG